MSHSSTYPDLIASPLLVDLPDGLANQFLDQSVLHRFEERGCLLRQGSQTPGVFLIAVGHAEISFSDEGGNVSIIHIAGPGEVLGEAEALAEQPCAASCIAMPGSRILLFPKAALPTYIRQPVFIRNVAAILHDRLVRNNRARSLVDYASVDVRLSTYLWQMSASKRSVEVSQDYLAMVVGCSRETINRRLRRLRDEGVLSLERGRVTVRDRDRLRV